MLYLFALKPIKCPGIMAYLLLCDCVCITILLWLSVIYGIFVAQSVDRRIIFYHVCFIPHQITVYSIGLELRDCTRCKNEVESHVVKWNIWNSSFFPIVLT